MIGKILSKRIKLNVPRMKNGGQHENGQVLGRMIEYNPPLHVKVFVHRALEGDWYSWNVAEYSTGCIVGHGYKMKEAVDDFEYRYEQKGSLMEAYRQRFIDKFGIVNQ
jgi:hypothetical protein